MVYNDLRGLRGEVRRRKGLPVCWILAYLANRRLGEFRHHMDTLEDSLEGFKYSIQVPT